MPLISTSSADQAAIAATAKIFEQVIDNADLSTLPKVEFQADVKADSPDVMNAQQLLDQLIKHKKSGDVLLYTDTLSFYTQLLIQHNCRSDKIFNEFTRSSSQLESIMQGNEVDYPESIKILVKKLKPALESVVERLKVLDLDKSNQINFVVTKESVVKALIHERYAKKTFGIKLGVYSPDKESSDHFLTIFYTEQRKLLLTESFARLNPNTPAILASYSAFQEQQSQLATQQRHSGSYRSEMNDELKSRVRL